MTCAGAVDRSDWVGFFDLLTKDQEGRLLVIEVLRYGSGGGALGGPLSGGADSPYCIPAPDGPDSAGWLGGGPGGAPGEGDPPA